MSQSPPPLQNQIDELSSRLSTIEQVLTKMIEAEESRATQYSPTPVAAPSMATSTPANPVAPVFAPTAAPAVSPPDTSNSLDFMTGNWLGIVGIICFVFAAAFIVKLAVDSGWLTPERQIGLAALLGFGLIGFGLWFSRKQADYAALLPAAGAIVLHLSALGAFWVHKLIDAETALAIIASISALCIWLYSQLKHDMYLLTAVVGAYLAPALVNIEAHSEFQLYYFLTCSMAFGFIATRFSHRLMAIVASYLGIAMISLMGVGFKNDLAIAIALPFHFGIFSVATFAQTELTGKMLTRTAAWSFFPVLLFFYSSEYFFINRLNPDVAPWASLAFAGLLIGLSFLAKRSLKADRLESSDMISAFSAVVLFHSVYLELLPPTTKPWLFVVICLFWASGASQRVGSLNTRALSVPIVLVGAVLIIEFMSIAANLASLPLEANNIAVGFASVAALYTLYFKPENVDPAKGSLSNALLTLAHVLAVLAFYRLLKDQGSLAVSGAWLAYAISIIAWGFARKDGTMATSAIIALLAAGAKALLYDAASAPTAVRIFCLLLTGAVFYGCGFLFRKIAAWPKLETRAQ